MLCVKFQSQIGRELRKRIVGQFPIGVNNLQLANWHQEAQNIDHQIILSLNQSDRLVGATFRVPALRLLWLPPCHFLVSQRASISCFLGTSLIISKLMAVKSTNNLYSSYSDSYV